jgi:hypothetical protein
VVEGTAAKELLASKDRLKDCLGLALAADMV